MDWLLKDGLPRAVFSWPGTRCLGGVLPSAGIFVGVEEGSETAVCDDFLELREEAEGVGLWSNLSSASLRLTVFIRLSEPESWLLSAAVSGRDSSMPSSRRLSALTSA